MSEFQVVISLVDQITDADLYSFVALFMYQGFSPELVFRHLAKIKSDKNISSNEFKNDIKTLIVMGVVMGNYNSNNSKKISDEGKSKGDALFQKYELKMGGIGKDKKMVNLPRLLAAFPITAAKLALSAPARLYGNEFGTNTVARIFQMPVFPSLVPTNMINSHRQALLAVATCYAAEQTMAITQKKDAFESFVRQKDYTKISHTSSVPTNEERKDFLATVDFASYKEFKNVIDNLNKKLDKKDQIVVPEVASFLAQGIKFSPALD